MTSSPTPAVLPDARALYDKLSRKLARQHHTNAGPDVILRIELTMSEIERLRCAVIATPPASDTALLRVTDPKGFITLHEPNEDGDPGDLVASVWRDDWLDRLALSPPASDAAVPAGEVCNCQRYPTHQANDCPLHGLEAPFDGVPHPDTDAKARAAMTEAEARDMLLHNSADAVVAIMRGRGMLAAAPKVASDTGAGLREALRGLELTEDGYSLRNPYDGDAGDDGREIVTGGDIVVTFTDSTQGENARDAILAIMEAQS